MGLNRRITRGGSFEKNSDMYVLPMKYHPSCPHKIRMMHRRKEREGKSKQRKRMVGKILFLSICFGGSIIDSGSVASAYIPNHRIGAYSRTIRRTCNSVQTRLVVSASKLTAVRTDQVNATNSTGEVLQVGDTVTQSSSDSIDSHTPQENFFREDMYNLKSLLDDEEIGESSDVPYFVTSRNVEYDENNHGNLYSLGLGTYQQQLEEKSSEYEDDETNGNGSQKSILRRIRPLKAVKRFLRKSSDESDDDTDTDFDTYTNATITDDDSETSTKTSRLRKLFRNKNVSDLEEGIERTNALAFLLNKAIVNAKPSQERSYVERSLMGLINGLAEEVEDLDIDIKTTSKTPFWRKEVDEIRINFSRLGFRPLQLGGTNTIVEIVDADSDESSTNGTSNGLDALVTNTTNELSFIDCPDEGFDRIDEDGSGTLDKDELAQALNSISGLETDKESIQELASDLVRLYDDNGDGVVDREEYQKMVEDMAKLRAQKEAEEKDDQKNPFVAVKDSIQSVSVGISNRAGEVVSAARDKYFSEKNLEDEAETEMGSIVLSKVKLDLRRIVFGAFPIVKKITPGGPLILEPLTATVTASFSAEDVMGSFLLDAALRRLVARSLRVRIRSYRDLTEGALFVGRRWKMFSTTAPVVEVLELSKVEFDSRDKMVVTGRARFRADPDAPVVTSTFKLRTKIGTRKNGQVIKLKEPELAFVFECPKALEKGLATVCGTFGLPPPKRPDPYYSFFPIYSPFKVDDDSGGFDMGEDNNIRSIFVKNGKLRFEMSVVLRPGRFLGNHYLAFTVPQRTFIITMDRVWNGIRAARENKKVADREKKKKEKALKAEEKEKQDVASSELLISSEDTATESTSTIPSNSTEKEASNRRSGIINTIKENTPTPKSFYTRFVEGYTMIEREEEATNERITNDISDWFGRQGLRDDDTSTAEDKPEEN